VDVEKLVDDLRDEVAALSTNQKQLIVTVDDLTERVYELEKRVVTLAQVAHAPASH
jgi:cell division septum initiation protein DivIVA